mgnify:CR=1 FL=1
MRRLTTFIAVIFAAAAFAPLRAQSLDAFKERLAAPVVSDAAFGTARVTVTEYGDAEKAVDDASRVGQRLRLRGYRVCSVCPFTFTRPSCTANLASTPDSTTPAAFNA